MNEWVPLSNFPGYSISPLGRVVNDATGEQLHVRVNQYGVAYVGMMRNGAQITRSLALLVARTFIPQPNPIFDTPINLNGDRRNCHVENLAWRPYWYARFYNAQFKHRYSHPILVPVKAVGEREVFSDSLAAASYYGLLEREVVLSVLNHTVTWPTFQQFELVQVV